MKPSAYAPDAARWQAALAGDRDAFEAAVEPVQQALLRAARRQVGLARAAGRLNADALTPEELAGETLVRAYELRQRYAPERLRFFAWLLGLQHRALARLVREERDYADRKALSLDERVPTGEDQDAVEEAFYEFRMPFDAPTYGSLIPGAATDEEEAMEVALGTDINGNGVVTGGGLTPEAREALAAGALDEADLDPAAREAALLYDEFDLSLGETALILDASLKDTAAAVNLARVTLRERIGSDALPDDPDDAVDSYTGDPVR